MNIAFIPVRCGSKSIPLKNIKIFCGKPLVYWSLKSLQDSESIDAIHVATDCEKIASIVSSFSFSKVTIYERDSQNATDESSTESVMLEFLNKNHYEDNDLFLLVQATSPLTKASDFDQAIQVLKQEKKDSLLTCVRTKRFFWSDDNTPANYDFNNRPRRQDFQGSLMENGAFYINNVGNIKKYGNRLSGDVAIYEMKDYNSIEIDEDDDWMAAESLMYKYILKKTSKKQIKLFLSDVDGTLTDAGMYYGESGEEFKKFNTHDGKGFELLRLAGIKTGILTSENTNIVRNRAKKLKVDYLFQGIKNKEKLKIVEDICLKEGLSINNIAYIGDDINCKDLLQKVGLAACPLNAVLEVKNIPNIIHINKRGGDGAVRYFIDRFVLK